MKSFWNWKAWLVALALSANVASAGFPAPKLPGVSKKNPHEQQLVMARVLERKGEDEKARQVYESVLKKSPKVAEAHHRLGVIAARDGQFDLARKHFNQALAITPNDATILSDLGYALFLENKLDEAEQCLQRAVRLDDSNRAAWNNLGLVLGHQDRNAAALDAFRQAGSEAEASANLAYIQAQKGNLDSAEALYSRALSHNGKLRPAAEGLIQVAGQKRKLSALGEKRETSPALPQREEQLAQEHQPEGPVAARPSAEEPKPVIAPAPSAVAETQRPATPLPSQAPTAPARREPVVARSEAQPQQPEQVAGNQQKPEISRRQAVDAAPALPKGDVASSSPRNVAESPEAVRRSTSPLANDQLVAREPPTVQRPRYDYPTPPLPLSARQSEPARSARPQGPSAAANELFGPPPSGIASSDIAKAEPTAALPRQSEKPQAQAVPRPASPPADQVAQPAPRTSQPAGTASDASRNPVIVRIQPPTKVQQPADQSTQTAQRPATPSPAAMLPGDNKPLQGAATRLPIVVEEPASQAVASRGAAPAATPPVRTSTPPRLREETLAQNAQPTVSKTVETPKPVSEAVARSQSVLPSVAQPPAASSKPVGPAAAPPATQTASHTPEAPTARVAASPLAIEDIRAWRNGIRRVSNTVEMPAASAAGELNAGSLPPATLPAANPLRGLDGAPVASEQPQQALFTEPQKPVSPEKASAEAKQPGRINYASEQRAANIPARMDVQSDDSTQWGGASDAASMRLDRLRKLGHEFRMARPQAAPAGPAAPPSQQ